MDRGRADRPRQMEWHQPDPAAENFQRTPKTNSASGFWEFAVDGLRADQYWSGQIGRLILEYRLDDDPPLARNSS